MTWQDLGGLGEFIGSIAVVVSLMFVIHELRRSSRINRVSALQAANAIAFAVYDAPARDAELARIIRVGGDDLSRLIRGFLSRPGMLVIWSRSKGVFRRDFQDWVASIVDDSNRSIRNESAV